MANQRFGSLNDASESSPRVVLEEKLAARARGATSDYSLAEASAANDDPVLWIHAIFALYQEGVISDDLCAAWLFNVVSTALFLEEFAERAARERRRRSRLARGARRPAKEAAPPAPYIDPTTGYPSAAFNAAASAMVLRAGYSAYARMMTLAPAELQRRVIRGVAEWGFESHAEDGDPPATWAENDRRLIFPCASLAQAFVFPYAHDYDVMGMFWDYGVHPYPETWILGVAHFHRTGQITENEAIHLVDAVLTCAWSGMCAEDPELDRLNQRAEEAMEAIVWDDPVQKAETVARSDAAAIEFEAREGVLSAALLRRCGCTEWAALREQGSAGWNRQAEAGRQERFARPGALTQLVADEGSPSPDSTASDEDDGVSEDEKAWHYDRLREMVTTRAGTEPRSVLQEELAPDDDARPWLRAAYALESDGAISQAMQALLVLHILTITTEGVAGRDREVRALADALRLLSGSIVTTDAEDDDPALARHRDPVIKRLAEHYRQIWITRLNEHGFRAQARFIDLAPREWYRRIRRGYLEWEGTPSDESPTPPSAWDGNDTRFAFPYAAVRELIDHPERRRSTKMALAIDLTIHPFLEEWIVAIVHLQQRGELSEDEAIMLVDIILAVDHTPLLAGDAEYARLSAEAESIRPTTEGDRSDPAWAAAEDRWETVYHQAQGRRLIMVAGLFRRCKCDDWIPLLDSPWDSAWEKRTRAGHAEWQRASTA